MYIWEKPGWPAFTCDEPGLSRLLVRVAHEQGRLLGKMEGLGFDLRREAHLSTLTDDVVKSSEIEGEMLGRDQVRSSIARRLGMDTGGLVQTTQDVEAVVEMTLDATGNYDKPLTEERLFTWHSVLFPPNRSGMRRIRAGVWRDDHQGPMQIVSGPLGRERVHYQAPPATRVPEEMTKFLTWFEASDEMDPLLKSGLAHLWFVTIHPFDDGNGRIARTIADMTLARAEGSAQRFYSVSAQIRREHKEYYQTLERTQKGAFDVTRWQTWFLKCVQQAIERSQEALSSVLDKSRFWQRFASEPLNRRQIKVLNKLLDGSEGKLTSSTWARLAKCSQDTAHRDILDLVARGALQKNPGGGRSTSYSLA